MALVTRPPTLAESDAAPTLAEVQAAGFPVGGETLAVDLADTLVRATTERQELLVDQAVSDRFWRLHDKELPPGCAPPTLAATRRLRDAIRILLDAAHEAAPLDPQALGLLNTLTAAATSSTRIELGDDGPQQVRQWHFTDPEALTLAVAARSAIDLLTLPALRSNLRRCASSNCTMYYVRGDARRKWCTSNICGNRDRVARHYRRRLE